MTNEIVEKTFNELFTQANEEQKLAIEAVEGPVMVMAGPGTGKTQILALRIVNMILNHGILPQNILCLTYSNAATQAMKARLAEKMNLGAEASKIAIETFHSFCNRVINENSKYFGDNENLEPATDLEQNELFRIFADTLPLDHILKGLKSNAYSRKKGFESLYESLDKENINVETLIKALQAYILDLPNQKDYIYQKKSGDYKKGDLKLQKIEDEKEKVEKTIAALNEHWRYKKIYNENGKYTFNDMIIWVIKCFKTHDHVLQRYQEKYQYILVDEFQDTNGSQLEILDLLSDYATRASSNWENPNLFVVGDDDQSIYSFQGAKAGNSIHFQEKYAQFIQTIQLKINYRSPQKILNHAYQLIKNNYDNEQLKTQGALSAFKPKQENENLEEIECLNFINSWHEDVYIVKQILALQAQGVSLKEISVIFTKHTLKDNLVKLLQHHNIPFISSKNVDILEEPLVKEYIMILEILKYADAKPVDYSATLFYVLHFSVFGIHPWDLIKINTEAQRQKMSFMAAVQNSSILYNLVLASTDKIIAATEKIYTWVRDIKTHTPQMVFEKILQEGAYFKMILESPEKLWLMQITITFFNFLKLESAKQKKFTVANFLEKIYILRGKDFESGIGIPVLKVYGTQEGVNLNTAYGSKGLEFDYVFIKAASKNYWEGKRGDKKQFYFPVEVPLIGKEKKDVDAILEEARRLFYVAITRAKKSVKISYSHQDIEESDTTKARDKSVFLEEIKMQDSAIANLEIVFTDTEIADFAHLSLLQPPIPNLKEMEENYVNNLLETFKLSASSLNSYLRCKLSFYMERILRIPEARKPYIAFGNAIHKALENLFKEKSEKDGSLPSCEAFIGFFEKDIKRAESDFTEAEFPNYIQLGKNILSDIYQNKVPNWNKKVLIEYDIKDAKVKNVPLSGRLDKMEFVGNQIHVVDYKTGSSEELIKKKLKAPKEDLFSATYQEGADIGGDIWRQIVFYKILLDNQLRFGEEKKWEMVSGEVFFVELDDKFNKNTTFKPSQQEIKWVEAQIVETYKGIQAHDFVGCGKKDCYWCNFVNHTYPQELKKETEIS